jgi:hypothetical protein
MTPYISSLSHNNGKVVDLGEKSISKLKKFPLDDDEGDVGGLNCTFRLVKPLITMSLYFESCVTFVMNPKP